MIDRYFDVFGYALTKNNDLIWLQTIHCKVRGAEPYEGNTYPKIEYGKLSMDENENIVQAIINSKVKLNNGEWKNYISYVPNEAVVKVLSQEYATLDDIKSCYFPRSWMPYYTTRWNSSPGFHNPHMDEWKHIWEVLGNGNILSEKPVLIPASVSKIIWLGVPSSSRHIFDFSIAAKVYICSPDGITAISGLRFRTYCNSHHLYTKVAAETVLDRLANSPNSALKNPYLKLTTNEILQQKITKVDEISEILADMIYEDDTDYESYDSDWADSWENDDSNRDGKDSRNFLRLL